MGSNGRLWKCCNLGAGSDRFSPVERKKLVIAELQFKVYVAAILERFVSQFGQKGLLGACNIVPQFRCAVHLVALCQVGANCKYLSAAYSDAALGRVI